MVFLRYFKLGKGNLFIIRQRPFWFTMLLMFFSLVCCFSQTRAATDPGYFSYSVSGTTCTITGSKPGLPSDIEIPDVIDGYMVTTIQDQAFFGESLGSVIVPSSVTSIGSMAFYYCSNLSAAYFKGNAPSGGSSAFYGGAGSFAVYYKASCGSGFSSWSGNKVAIDDVAPTVSNVTPIVLGAGTVLHATSNENGTIYLVPKGSSYTSQAKLTAAAKKSVNVLANIEANIITTGVPDGAYQIYAVDNASTAYASARANLVLGPAPNISAASADILIGTDTTGPTLINVTPTALKAGTVISVTSNETGKIYLVPKGIYTSKSALSLAALSYATVTTAGSPVTINTSYLAEGIYQIYAVDSSDNISASPVDITIDETRPALTHVTPTALKAGIALSVTNNEPCTVYLVPKGTYGSRTDLDGASPKQTVAVTTSGSAVTIDTALITSDGLYQVYAADAAGNISSASPDITIDNTLPVLSSVTPTLLNTKTDIISATSSETGRLYLVPKGTYTSQAELDGASPKKWVAVMTAGLAVTIDAVIITTNGIYQVYAVDAVGNLSAASADITIDNTAPTLSDVTPTLLKAGTEISARSNETGTIYLVPKKPSYIGENALIAAAKKALAATKDTQVKVDTTDVADGTYQIYAVDAAGNLSAASADIIIDTTGPALSSVTPKLLKAGTGISVTSSETGTVYLVPERPSYTSQAELEGASPKRIVAVTTAGSVVTVDTAGLADGAYQIYAIDDLANLSAAPVEIAVDSTGPVLSVSSTALKLNDWLYVTSNEDDSTIYVVPKGPSYSSQAELAGASPKSIAAATTAGLAIGIWICDTSNLTNGIYQVYAVDAAGNLSAASADITIDITGPTISSVSLPADKTYITGDRLEFIAHFSEAVVVTTTGGTPYIPIILDNHMVVEALYDSGSGGKDLVFLYTVATGNLDEDGITVTGNINRNGGTITDTGGNNAILAFIIPDTTGIKVDGTAPTLTNVTIVSNNSNTSKARTGDTITLSFTASENIQTPTVTIAGNPATVNDAGDTDDTTWQAAYTIQGTEVEGPVAFNIAFEDLTGNAGAAVSGNSSFTYDKTAPTLTRHTPTGADIILGTALTLTFSEAVCAAAGDITIYKADNTEVETIAASQATINGSTVTITPTRKLAMATGYYVLIDDTAFRDAAGNAYAGFSDATTWSFTTTAATISVVFSRPTADAILNINTGSTVIVKLIDNGSGIDTSKVTIRIDDGMAVAPTARVKTSDGYTLYYVITSINYGTADNRHTVTVTAADSAGVISSGSVTFTMEPKRKGFGFGRLRFD